MGRGAEGGVGGDQDGIVRSAALVAVLLLVTSPCVSHRAEQTFGSLAAISPPRPVSGPWVLWWGINERYWSRHSGYESATECEQGLARMRALVTDVGLQFGMQMGQQNTYYAVKYGKLIVPYTFRREPEAVDLGDKK